jgi:hypothetical protein
LLPLAGSTIATNPNEVVRIELATSLAYFARIDLAEVTEIYGLSEDVSLRQGRVYSDKAPGLSFAAVPAVWIAHPVLPRTAQTDLPAYWPLRHVLTLLLVALPTLGLSLLIARSTPAIEPGRRSAIFAVTALATPLWTYGTVFFGHAPAALLITLAWYVLIGFPGLPHSLSVGRGAIGGAAAAFAVATEYPTILLVAAIILTLVGRRTPLPILAGVAAGMLAGALPAMVYHQLAFGAPWLTGYGSKAHGDFQAIHTSGLFGISLPTLDSLWGIMFSARRGIFFYCPLLLLAPVGLWQLKRDRGWREAGPILAAVAAYIVFASGFVDWQAGWCAAARHLIPVVPLLVVVALSAASVLVKNRWGAIIVIGLIAVSGANTVLTIVLTPYFPPEFPFPIAQLVMPSLVAGAGFDNLLSVAIGVAPTTVVMLVITISIGVLIWALARLVGDHGWRIPVVYLATLGVLFLLYGWRGLEPPTEIELMRAQVLHRLGHHAVADRLEDSLLSVAEDVAD